MRRSDFSEQLLLPWIDTVMYSLAVPPGAKLVQHAQAAVVAVPSSKMSGRDALRSGGGACGRPGGRTVMPRRVSGKFSIRLVPDMEPEKTGELVKKHLERMWAEEVGSKYKLTVNMIHGGPAWVSSTDHPNYVAATRAVEKVFKRPPDLTREGGSIPVANWLADATGMNVLLLPTSASNDGAHAQNSN